MIGYLIAYIIAGAIIGSVYYYLQLLRDKYDRDVFFSVWCGILWPIVSPFAFGLYLARYF